MVQLLDDIDELPAGLRFVATVGVFDGVPQRGGRVQRREHFRHRSLDVAFQPLDALIRVGVLALEEADQLREEGVVQRPADERVPHVQHRLEPQLLPPRRQRFALLLEAGVLHE